MRQEAGATTPSAAFKDLSTSFQLFERPAVVQGSCGAWEAKAPVPPRIPGPARRKGEDIMSAEKQKPTRQPKVKTGVKVGPHYHGG
jgi:hypothetical protein